MLKSMFVLVLLVMYIVIGVMIITAKHRAHYSIFGGYCYTVMYPSIGYDQTHDTPTLVDLNDFRQQKVLIFL